MMFDYGFGYTEEASKPLHSVARCRRYGPFLICWTEDLVRVRRYVANTGGIKELGIKLCWRKRVLSYRISRA